MTGKKNYPRRRRVASLLREALAREIPLLPRDGLFFIATIREVRPSADYATARVYYTLLDAGDDDARRRAADFFTANADRLRRRLAANLQMRRTPRLIFVLDENAENAEAMARFLDSIPPDDAPPTATT